MCAAFELNSRMVRPGKVAALWQRAGAARLVWAGFARSESLAWWIRKGGELADIPAHRFAERSDRDGKLRWDEVPPGLVLRGLIDPNDGKPLLKVVTRASTEAERTLFEHPRMPVMELPLFSAEPVAGGGDEGEEGGEDQLELFGG